MGQKSRGEEARRPAETPPPDLMASSARAQLEFPFLGADRAAQAEFERLFSRHPLSDEEFEAAGRHHLADRYKRVYDSFETLFGSLEGRGRYIHKRFVQDSAIITMLEKAFEAAGKSTLDARHLTDLGCGEARYVLALDSAFPQLSDAQLVDSDEARLSGARDRIRLWGADEGKYRTVACDLRRIGSDEAVARGRDVVTLINPNTMGDKMWRDWQAIGPFFDDVAGLLSPEGVFIYAGRLRELAPMFGISAKHGVEFETLPHLKSALGVEPFAQPYQEESGLFDGLSPTNMIVVPMTAEQTIRFGKLFPRP